MASLFPSLLTVSRETHAYLLVMVALLHNTQVSVIVLRLIFIYFCVCVCVCECSCLAVLVTDSTVVKEHRDHDNSVCHYCVLFAFSKTVALVVLELGSVDQALQHLTEICLPLLTECWD